MEVLRTRSAPANWFNGSPLALRDASSSMACFATALNCVPWVSCRGFQWLDGSFTEDVEARENRAPKDIDLVTFMHPPEGKDKAAVKDMLTARPDLFDQERCKHQFHCDTNIVNLSTAPEWLVTQSRYWYGLYSHRRGDALWKGMLQLPLNSDDIDAGPVLDRLWTQGDADAGPT